MRHNTILKGLMISALALALFSCKKESEMVTLNVAMENNFGQKVYLDNGDMVNWHNGDKIKVNTSTVTVVNHTVTIAQASSYTAVFPVSNNNTNQVVVIPAVQEYTVAEGKQKLNAPMAARLDSRTGTLMFRNLAAVIEVDVTNPSTTEALTLSEIKVSSTTEDLCGNQLYTMANPTTTSLPQLNPIGTGTGAKAVKLVFNSTETLAARANKKYYLYVAKFTNADLKVEVTGKLASDTRKYVYTMSSTNSHSLGRAQLMPITMNMSNRAPMPFGFSVSATKVVAFAPGNLQYNINPGADNVTASKPMWRFAEHPWDFIGENANIVAMWNRMTYDYPSDWWFGTQTPSYDVTQGNHWIDIFCWGTSGAAGTLPPYYVLRDAGPNGTGYHRDGYTDLTPGHVGNPNVTWYPGSTDFSATSSDWGRNTIYNPSTGQFETPGTWRTLTGGPNGEWHYVAHVRAASTVNGVTNARFAKARVNVSGNYINGLILFPDDYTHPAGVPQPNSINETNVTCTANTYSASEMISIANAGAVFLPLAGTRWGWGRLEVIQDVQWTGVTTPVTPNSNLNRAYADNSEGYYWSSTPRNTATANTFRFLNQASTNSDNVDGANNYNRDLGCSVRLVRDLN